MRVESSSITQLYSSEKCISTKKKRKRKADEAQQCKGSEICPKYIDETFITFRFKTDHIVSIDIFL